MKLTTQVREFMQAAGQSRSDTPRVPAAETRILNAKLIFEEFLEYCAAANIELRDAETGYAFGPVDFEFYCYEDEPVILKDVYDSFLDCGYVVEGGQQSWGFDTEPGMDLVHENNMTKFVDGYRDEGGKWRKGPSYKPLDLTAEVERQIRGEKTLKWVPYHQKEEINVPNGLYISSDGKVADFVSGPRDTHVWLIKDGRVIEGLPKEDFVKEFKAFG